MIALALKLLAAMAGAPGDWKLYLGGFIGGVALAYVEGRIRR